jgi:lysozyme family protein
VAFDDWIGLILKAEGPEINENVDEPGGISCYGVSLSSLADYNKANKLPSPTRDDVRSMTEDRAKQFYAWFFTPLRLNDLPDAIAYRLADIATNIGRSGGVAALEMALMCCGGSAVVKWPFPEAINDAYIVGIKSVTPTALITALSAYWVGYKHAQTATGWVKYNHGWTNRLLEAQSNALGLIK